MDINWDNIREILSGNNQKQIDKAKLEVLDSMCSIAKERSEQGASVQGITAVTFAHNELELRKRKSDCVLLFRQEMLLAFIERQNMSLYQNPQNIQEGDAIAIKTGKTGRITYDVIKVGKGELVVRPVNYMDGRKLQEETIKVNGRSFICGIHLNKMADNHSHSFIFFFKHN